MDIVAITRHAGLVGHLRAAFEGTGHGIRVIPDQLQALALEAWKDAHLLLVDAEGDPLDGWRFCSLLRGESRPLFRNLPIFLVQGAQDVEASLLPNADADGLLSAHDGPERLRALLGPPLEGRLTSRDGPGLPLLLAGFTKTQRARIETLTGPFGFRPVPCAARTIAPLLDELKAPILLVALDPEGGRTLSLIQAARQHAARPNIVLAGRLPDEGLQRKLTLAGIDDWIPLPLSAALVLHALRRSMECRHLARLQQEFRHNLAGMHERSRSLELEANSLRSEALTDPLTGLLNRRAFNQRLDLALDQWARHGRPFVLVLGDIDYFKLINDRFGHLAGDHVLKHLADRVRGSLRRSDLAFRIGGEEFAILLMETSLQAGTEVADKLRRRIDENPIHLETGQSILPTVSFGVGSPGSEDSETPLQGCGRGLVPGEAQGQEPH